LTYQDPNDSDPATRNGANLGEAPVAVRGDDGRNELGNAEGEEQGSRGTLHEEETVRPSHENESLRDDGNLEVDDHVEHTIVGSWDAWRVFEVDAKLILEEGGPRTTVDRVRYNSKRSQLSGVIKGKTRPTERVMPVPSLRRAITITMKGGKLNL
jgi:hypothetical protein